MNISIVCPFFNEENIIELSTKNLLKALNKLPHNWELVLVNDGSTDRSLEYLEPILSKNPNIVLTGYEHNKGRGAAIHWGIQKSTGDYIITTEIDLSWGEEIIQKLVEALQRYPDADMIIASPNIRGGGYKNVPNRRVLISKIGNLIIRAGQSTKITMFTGMTRAYKRAAILDLPIDEKGKEFHLEVAQKALAFKYSIYEIPCVLEWKDQKFARRKGHQRASSSKMPQLMKSHLAFAAVTAPVRYIIPVSAVCLFFSITFLITAFVNILNGNPSAFYLITGLSLLSLSAIIFSVGMISYQINLLRHDIWRLRRDQRKKIG